MGVVWLTWYGGVGGGAGMGGEPASEKLMGPSVSIVLIPQSAVSVANPHRAASTLFSSRIK
tara:strand:+ start:312 stop:494 length:183 start_codon:yes stop_codon:yes gene_type:complete